MAGRIDEGADELVEAHEINVTPFIDVMLVLLIIFMVAAPLSTVDVHVDLPVSTARPQPRPDKPLYLTIKSDLSLNIGNESIARAQLAAAIETATQSDKGKRLFLRADQTVPYGELMNVLNMLRAAGYLKIALVGLESVGGTRRCRAGRPETGRARAHPGQAAVIPSVDLVEPRRRRLTRWIGAATLISAIHLGGGSFAMLYWQEEFVEEAPGAIVVEIAPIATALEADTTALLGKLSDEREATQAASDRKVQKVEEEAPKEDLPSPAEPEVALPKPTPVEEKPKEEVKEETSPQVRVAQEATAASKATAPLRTDAPTLHQVGGARRRHGGQQRAHRRVLAELGGAADQSAKALSRRSPHAGDAGGGGGAHRHRSQRPADGHGGGAQLGLCAAGSGGARNTQAGFAAAALCLSAVQGETLHLTIPIRFRIQ